ncbi:MAG TPA: CpXC domain-containing protein [Planctomycetota bacterium]|nr:CpXC domain-containing protein [Planctomycetota bacterium]
MSSENLETIPCPECKHPQPFTVWSSVNVSLNPELKDKILDRSIDKFVCEKCGHTAQVAHPMLYHDMDRKLMVWLVYQGEIPEGGPSAIGTLEGYRFRRVRSYEELMEKIMIDDEKLDDRVIEVMKLAALSMLEEKKDRTNDRLYFEGSGLNKKGDPVMSLAVISGEQAGQLSVPHGFYSEVARLIEARNEEPQEGWLSIDREYAVNVLKDVE